MLWLLFFLLLGLDGAEPAAFTGAGAVAERVPTAGAPAWLSLTGVFRDSGTAAALGGVGGLVLLAVLWWVTARRGRESTAAA